LKMEGASDEILTLTKRLTEAGIPVVAHLGLTPQTVNVLGGYKVQGKDREAGEQLLQDAKNLEANGAVALVLECVPKELAKIVTEPLRFLRLELVLVLIVTVKFSFIMTFLSMGSTAYLNLLNPMPI